MTGVEGRNFLMPKISKVLPSYKGPSLPVLSKIGTAIYPGVPRIVIPPSSVCTTTNSNKRKWLTKSDVQSLSFNFATRSSSNPLKLKIPAYKKLFYNCIKNLTRNSLLSIFFPAFADIDSLKFRVGVQILAASSRGQK